MRHTEINGIRWFLKDKTIEEILRGFYKDEDKKRGHFTAGHSNGKIFIKSFKEKGFYGFVRNRVLPRGKKEFLVGMKLTALSILTPEPLGYGISDSGSYVVQKWIDGITFIDAYGSSDKKTELLIKLASLLKALKTFHIRHNDLHLNNILYKDGALYLVDLHKMQIKRFFSLADEVSNLAHAITMVYQDMDEGEKDAFFREYGDEGIKSHVETELRRLRHRWIKKKMDRAFDDTSMMTTKDDCVYIAGCEGLGKGVLVAVLKDDRKTRVERFSDHIRKTYRDSRRLNRAWKNHVALTYLNLDIVPRAFFVKKPSLSAHCFVAMEDMSGRGEELDRYLDRRYDNLSVNEKRRFVDKLSIFFAHAVRHWVVHRDVKACNIFVLENDDFKFLDVEDISFEEINENVFIRMLVQLNTTIPKRISTQDRMRFFLRLSTFLKMKNKAVFRVVVADSIKSDIVYEGVSGLVKEHW